MEAAAGLRVLHVDDEQAVLDSVASILGRRGIKADSALDSATALRLAKEHDYDVALVDIRMPKDIGGLPLSRELRVIFPCIGLIMVTALDQSHLRVYTLKEFADDYIVKPINPSDLEARIRAVARRSRSASSRPPANDLVLEYNGLRLDLIARKVKLHDTPIHLQPKQFEVLAFLMRYIGQAITEESLRLTLWQTHHDNRASVVRVQISKLRAALGPWGDFIENREEGGGWGIALSGEAGLGGGAVTE